MNVRVLKRGQDGSPADFSRSAGPGRFGSDVACEQSWRRGPDLAGRGIRGLVDVRARRRPGAGGCAGDCVGRAALCFPRPFAGFDRRAGAQAGEGLPGAVARHDRGGRGRRPSRGQVRVGREPAHCARADDQTPASAIGAARRRPSPRRGGVQCDAAASRNPRPRLARPASRGAARRRPRGGVAICDARQRARARGLGRSGGSRRPHATRRLGGRARDRRLERRRPPHR